jgi:hypothetical protein
MDKGDVLTLTQLLVEALLPTQFVVIVIDPASIYFELHCMKNELGQRAPGRACFTRRKASDVHCFVRVFDDFAANVPRRAPQVVA